MSLKTLSRSVDVDTPTLWYAQDAGGAIWKIDIVVSHTVSHNIKYLAIILLVHIAIVFWRCTCPFCTQRKAPEKLMSFHSGEITGLDCSPLSYQAASISHNGEKNKEVYLDPCYIYLKLYL